MFQRVLVANRGAVARRVIRALRSLGIESVAVYSDAEAGAPHVEEADLAFRIGPGPAKESYLNQERILGALEISKADALHPGYGFLSENGSFARRVEAAGAQFIGPSPRWLDAMGHKTQARALMERHGMPMAPGSPVLGLDDESVLAHAKRIGFPVLIKPAAGGGGIGMIAAAHEGAIKGAIEQARTMSQRAFGVSDIYLERLVKKPRHIEFQVLADRAGEVRHIFERDCSVQRRHQKVIEESPAPLVGRDVIRSLGDQVAAILKAIGYDNIGTVEMLCDENGGFSFLEMNTRLQVEHAVTEVVTGVDLVVAQIRAAAGERVNNILPAAIPQNGHAIEARVCAEDSWTHYPSPGKLETFRPPCDEGIRVETGYIEGCVVSPYYDSLLGKVIVHAATREGAIEKLDEALEHFAVKGVKTNIEFLRAVLQLPDFRMGSVHTSLAESALAERRKASNE
jgi:acetyl-CoA carboxylase biotin carboxylase subunit